jgi:hypothetical protein
MRAIKILQQTICPLLGFVHATRLAAVLWAVGALVRGGKLYLTALGRHGAGSSMTKHAIKRADRLLGNEHLHAQVPLFFAAVAMLLIGSRQRPVVLVDWTLVGTEHVALVAAVPLDGRSLPIYLEVHPKKKDNNPAVMRRFLKKLHEVLPQRCRPIIVTDAGFRNDWFADVAALGWDFVGRVRSNPLVRDLVNPEWFPAKKLYEQATSRAKDLGLWLLVQMNPRPVRLVLAKKWTRVSRSMIRGTTMARKARSRAFEPWLLATSLAETEAKRVVDLYAKRMQIEETFRDAKNHRFGWSFKDAQSGSTKRYEVLLLLATLGMLAATMAGSAAESSGEHKHYQANTVRERRVLSLFFLGSALLRHSETFFFPVEKICSTLREIREKMPSVAPHESSCFVGIP